MLAFANGCSAMYPVCGWCNSSCQTAPVARLPLLSLVLPVVLDVKDLPSGQAVLMPVCGFGRLVSVFFRENQPVEVN